MDTSSDNVINNIYYDEPDFPNFFKKANAEKIYDNHSSTSSSLSHLPSRTLPSPICPPVCLPSYSSSSSSSSQRMADDEDEDERIDEFNGVRLFLCDLHSSDRAERLFRWFHSAETFLHSGSLLARFGQLLDTNHSDFCAIIIRVRNNLVLLSQVPIDASNVHFVGSRDEYERRVEKVGDTLLQLCRHHAAGQKIQNQLDYPILPDHGEEQEGKRRVEEEKGNQELLRFVYTKAAAERLCRDDKEGDKANVYQPILSGGYNSHAFKLKCEMKKYIAQCVTPQDDHEWEYGLYTVKLANPQSVLANVTTLPDPRLPILKNKKRLFSFKNGIYDVRECKFFSLRYHTATKHIGFRRKVWKKFRVFQFY